MNISPSRVVGLIGRISLPFFGFTVLFAFKSRPLNGNNNNREIYIFFTEIRKERKIYVIVNIYNEADEVKKENSHKNELFQFFLLSGFDTAVE